MRNGYALPTRDGLAAATRHLARADASALNELRGLLRVGLHRDVEVTDGSRPGPLVNCTLGPEDDAGVIENIDPPVAVLRRDFDLATLADRDAVRAAVSSFRASANDALKVTLA